MDFDVQYFRKYLNKSRQEDFISYCNNDIVESYIIFKQFNGNINLYKIHYIDYDFDISADVSYTMSGRIEFNTRYNPKAIEDCKSLVTEYKQITEYENKIASLEKELEQVTKHRNRLWSDSIRAVTERTIYSDMQAVADADVGRLFAIWVDDYAVCNEGYIKAFYCLLPEDFTSTDYFTELFLPNVDKTLDSNKYGIAYDSPNTLITNGEKKGYNYLFVLANNEAFNYKLPELKWYPDEQIKVVRCNDRNYLYNTLDDIWFKYFGTKHPKEGI